MTFSAIAMLTPSAVYSLRASDYFHCGDESGTNRGISLHTYALENFFYK